MFTIDPDQVTSRRSGGKVRPLEPGGRIVVRYKVLQSLYRTMTQNNYLRKKHHFLAKKDQTGSQSSLSQQVKCNPRQQSNFKRNRT